MTLKSFSAFSLTIVILLEFFSQRSYASTCVDWIGSVHSFGSNRNPNFVWSTGIDRLEFRFQFHAVDKCDWNNSNIQNLTHFEILLSRQMDFSVINLQVWKNNCNATVANEINLAYKNLTAICRSENNNYAVIVTFIGPTPNLSAQNIILKAPFMTQNNGILAQTKPIRILSCSPKLDDHKLIFVHGPKKSTPKKDYNFNETALIGCKKFHQQLFATKDGKFVKPLFSPAVAKCNAFAEWDYKGVQCWHGPKFFVGHKSDKRTIAVADKPTLILCRNKNKTTIKSVQLQVGNKIANQSNDASWINITLPKSDNPDHHVAATCRHYANNGSVAYSEHLNIEPKEIKFVSINRHFRVRLGNDALILLPVFTNFPLINSHILIDKQGDKNHIKSFVVVTSKQDHHKHLIEVKLPKIKEKDLGNYSAKVFVNKNEFDYLEFELVAVDTTLSKGAIAAITISVLLCCGIIAVCFAILIRKFVKNQARVVEHDGERILIIDDNDDAINDDVFHDPPRSARIQEELLRRSEEPTTSSAFGQEPSEKTNEEGSLRGNEVI